MVRYGIGSAPTWHETAARIFFSQGSIVSGPRKQFMPTTSAPACSSRWQVSTMPMPSAISSIAIGAMVRTTGSPLAFATSSAASASPA